MAVMPRQAAFTVVSSSLLLNVYATEIERVASGTFANLTNTGRPRFLVVLSSQQVVQPNTDTTVLFNSAISDPRSMWTSSTQDIVTIKDPGDWLFYSQHRWGPFGTGIRGGKIMKNGTNPNTAGVTQASNSGLAITTGEGPTLVSMASCRVANNDIMRLNAFQGHTTALNLLTDFGSTFFGGTWMGP